MTITLTIVAPDGETLRGYLWETSNTVDAQACVANVMWDIQADPFVTEQAFNEVSNWLDDPYGEADIEVKSGHVTLMFVTE